MTPTAADIVSSPAWQEMQIRMEQALFEQFKRTLSADTEALERIRYKSEVMDDLVDELELMAREM